MEKLLLSSVDIFSSFHTELFKVLLETLQHSAILA